MEIIDQIGVALGLASLAGINLYLTVLIAACAIHFQWITLSGPYSHLATLDNPWIIGIAAVLFTLEFFADKIPWVDTIWDATHTFIRPIGGIALSLTALGQLDPSVSIIAGLLAGTASLATHSAKASSRVLINASPEPVSNSLASITEDAIVVGGLALIATHPFIAAILFTLIITIACLFSLWLWKKVSGILKNNRRPRPTIITPASAQSPPPA